MPHYKTIPVNFFGTKSTTQQLSIKGLNHLLL